MRVVVKDHRITADRAAVFVFEHVTDSGNAVVVSVAVPAAEGGADTDLAKVALSRALPELQRLARDADLGQAVKGLALDVGDGGKVEISGERGDPPDTIAALKARVADLESALAIAVDRAEQVEAGRGALVGAIRRLVDSL